ncbi:hypothetical protein CYMTET_11679 [Cymbomonas tetramitiformis]|uniref:Uncharacterized protein n=1 Tax=Cymbomonas tetramitiformis TaxID=36881 RepID=A0AAE0GM02_9CHLO|nr:hypothetical protein CYMTET_11679 [Cymbomonas tetramitiformis]
MTAMESEMPTWQTRARWGKTSQSESPLPCMDNFLVLARGEEEEYELRECMERTLGRLALRGKVKKGEWDPVQIIKHLGSDGRRVLSDGGKDADKYYGADMRSSPRVMLAASTQACRL